MATTENQTRLYDKRHQIDLIADSLIATANVYHHGDVSLHPFLDNLHLLVQEPRCISFLKQTDGRLALVYFSLRDPDLHSAFQKYFGKAIETAELKETSLQLPNTEYFICAHKILLDSQNGLKNPRFELVSADDFKQLFDRLSETQTELGNNVIDCLKRCLANLSPDLPPPQIDWSIEAKERNKAITHLKLDVFWKRLRAEIDLALGSAAHSHLLRNQSKMQNLFCVVRTATNLEPRRGFLGVFNYTAQVLLTTTQSEQIKLHTDPALLEKPLGAESRSIADSVFHSGLIDFSDETTGEGRDRWSRDRRFDDYLRHEAENLVYSKLSSSHRPHTFYVPIHVSGVPWIGLFTISPKPDNPTDPKWWSHNYGIYRALIPTVASKLRVGAKRLFLAYVSEIFGANLTMPDVASFVHSVNTSWKYLSYVMPFPVLELFTSVVDGSDKIALPHRQNVWLKLQDANPHFRRQVKYELLTQKEVLTICEEAARLAELERHRTVKETQEVMSYTVAHDTRSTLQNGVILPLHECLKHSDDPAALKAEIRNAIARVETYCEDVSFWLGGIADFYAPGAISVFQKLNSKAMSNVFSANGLALRDISALPQIESSLLGATTLDLHISEHSFKALFHLLTENAVDAIRETTKSVLDEKIRVTAQAITDGQPYCQFTFWNSSTKFTRPIRENAGHRPYTTAPRRSHSGLGFFIVEQLLKLCQAKAEPDGRHFVLENTKDPIGAKISFAIPLRSNPL